MGDVSGEQDAELLGRGAIILPDKRRELHIGRVQQLAALLLFGARQALGCLRLGQAALHFLLLGFHSGQSGCSLLLRLPGVCQRALQLLVVPQPAREQTRRRQSTDQG
jgi:hypothetical protein